MRNATATALRRPPASTNALNWGIGAVRRILQVVGDDDPLALRDTSQRAGSGKWANGAMLFPPFGKAALAAHRRWAETFAIVGVKVAAHRLAKAHRLFEHRVEYRREASPGEELMTCNTSAVAVCWSKASRVSVSSRAFSIAITACAAKFCNNAISLSENGRTSRRAEEIRPSSASSRRSGTNSTVRIPANSAAL